jgi:hypothetical protein
MLNASSRAIIQVQLDNFEDSTAVTASMDNKWADARNVQESSQGGSSFGEATSAPPPRRWHHPRHAESPQWPWRS